MEGVHDLWSAAVVQGPQTAEDLAGAGGEEGGLQAVDLIAVQFLGLGAGAGIRRVGLEVPDVGGAAAGPAGRQGHQVGVEGPLANVHGVERAVCQVQRGRVGLLVGVILAVGDEVDDCEALQVAVGLQLLQAGPGGVGVEQDGGLGSRLLVERGDVICLPARRREGQPAGAGRTRCRQTGHPWTGVRAGSGAGW